MIAPLSFTPQSVAFSFAYFAWGHFCLFRKERSLTDYNDIPGSVYYPLLILAAAAILDNLRLLIGLIYGKNGASKILAQIAYFAHMVVTPSLISTYSTYMVAMGVWSWIGTLGFIITVPFVVNGLNNFIADVLDYMEYTDDGDLPRYTLDEKRVRAYLLLLLMYICNIYFCRTGGRFFFSKID